MVLRGFRISARFTLMFARLSWMSFNCLELMSGASSLILVAARSRSFLAPFEADALWGEGLRSSDSSASLDRLVVLLPLLESSDPESLLFRFFRICFPRFELSPFPRF